MPRDLKTHELQKRAAARRSHQLGSIDHREPTAAREAAAGATSFPVKADDPTTRAAIEAFLSRRKEGL